MTKRMDKANTVNEMELPTKENGKIMLVMVMEYITMQKGTYIKDNGKVDRSMDMESTT